MHGATGLAPAEFFYLVACLEAAAGVDPGGPLFSGGAGAGPAPGSGGGSSGRRILAADHILCMTLFKMWAGCAIEALPAVFKVDLTAALRNVALAEDALANTGILPTDRAIMGELAGAAPRGGTLAAAAAGGAVSADWTRVRVELPAGRGPGSAHRPGGAVATTCKTLVGCSAEGIILFRGPALAGRGGDLEYLRRHLPAAGRTAASLADGGAPAAGRVRVNLDGGPRGAENILRGADVRMSHRGPLKHLAQDQTDLDSRLAGEHAVVEGAFAAIKSYRALGNVFRGSAADPERTLTIATGIVNLKRMLGRDKGREAPGCRCKRLGPWPQVVQGARETGRGILRRSCVPAEGWPALAPLRGAVAQLSDRDGIRPLRLRCRPAPSPSAAACRPVPTGTASARRSLHGRPQTL